MDSLSANPSFDDLGAILEHFPTPPLKDGDVFSLWSTDYGTGKVKADPISYWDLKESHFPSSEDFRIAQSTGRFWLSHGYKAAEFMRTGGETRAASRLDLLLLPHGGTEEQRAAVELFSTHFSTHLLGLNQHRDDDIEPAGQRVEYLVNLQIEGEKNGFLIGNPLFSDDPEEQEDLEHIHTRGLWTFHERRDENLVAAGSTPVIVLKKAWRVAPALEPLRRLSALDTQLPAPRPRKGPGRF